MNNIIVIEIILFNKLPKTGRILNMHIYVYMGVSVLLN